MAEGEKTNPRWSSLRSRLGCGHRHGDVAGRRGEPFHRRDRVIWSSSMVAWLLFSLSMRFLSVLDYGCFSHCVAAVHRFYHRQSPLPRPAPIGPLLLFLWVM